jgi:hypothetical protein
MGRKAAPPPPLPPLPPPPPPPQFATQAIYRGAGARGAPAGGAAAGGPAGGAGGVAQSNLGLAGESGNVLGAIMGLGKNKQIGG